MGILPLRHLFVFKVLKMFFNMGGNRNFRLFENRNLRTNSQYIVNIPKFNTTHYSKTFSIIAPTLFNKLPRELRHEQRFKPFHIKSWLFEISNIEEVLFNVIV